MLEVLRSGRLSLGPLLGEFERRFAARIGAPHASAVSSGTAGLHLALRAVGVSDGDEVITSPFSFVASANVIVYERARPVFVDIDPRTLTIDPAAAAAAVGPRTTALLPVHIFGWPADIAALERLGLPIVEDACEALGARARRRRGGRRARAPGGVRVLRQQADDDRRGRNGHARPTRARRSASTASATRAARRTWTGSTTTAWASTTASASSPARSGWRSSTASIEMLAARARVAAAYGEALAGIEGLELPCPDEGGSVRGWFVYTVSAAARGRPRRDDPRACALRGVQSKPYLPAIHLMSYYRERFGHRPGEFPVCEDVAARSLALPFHPLPERGRGRRCRRGADRGARAGIDSAHGDVALLAAAGSGLPGDQRVA